MKNTVHFSQMKYSILSALNFAYVSLGSLSELVSSHLLIYLRGVQLNLSVTLTLASPPSVSEIKTWQLFAPAVIEFDC